jgi:hypothetical protein
VQGPIVVNGSIVTADPTQTGRPVRDGFGENCGVTDICALHDTLFRHRDTYSYVNTASQTVCVTVAVDTACAGQNAIYVAGYVSSFSPGVICSGYVASLGSSPEPHGDFSFSVPAGNTLYVNVQEVMPDAGCASYQLTVSGLANPSCATPTPSSPTATPTRPNTPTPMPTACAPVLIEGFEGGLGTFTSEVALCEGGDCGWRPNANPHSGSMSAYAPNPPLDASDQRLVQTSPMVVPANTSMTFWHKYHIGAIGQICYDGAVLEMSLDNGASWQDAGWLIESGGYDAIVWADPATALTGREAWCGAHDDYRQVTLDLGLLAGRSVKFRFRLVTDSSLPSASGWWVDDVSVATGVCPGTPVATSTPTATPTSCPPGGPGEWLTEEPLPGLRMGAAVASVDGYLYEAGGHVSTSLRDAQVGVALPDGGSGFQTDRAARFDGSRWRPIPWLPEHLMNAAGASDGSKFYVIGGFQSSAVPVLNTLQIFDPATLTWTLGSPLPQQVAGAVAVYSDGRIYVMGGCTDAHCATTDALQVYNIATNSWTFGAPLPSSLAYGSAELVGGDIYLAGGADTNGGLSEAYRYSPQTDTWDDASVADMPEPWWGAASGVLNGKLHIFGGIVSNLPVPMNRAIVYDPVGDTWTESAPLNVATYRQEGDNLAGWLYIVGGSPGGFDATDRVERFAPDCGPTVPSPTPDGTGTPTHTRTSTPMPTQPPTGTATPTVEPTHTQSTVVTLTPQGTPEPSYTPTETPGATGTNTPTVAATHTAVVCVINFTDVSPDNTFYPFVRCLACRGILSGYPCGALGEPCNPSGDPYFRPNVGVTRAQLSKIVSNSAGYSEPPGEQAFEDVPLASPFFPFIQRLASRGHISGYPCGGSGEPCGAGNLPYFRPASGATRGQLTKIVSNAAGFSDPVPPTQYTFADVQGGSTFHVFVERLLLNRPGVMSGYPCGAHVEPCDEQNRPYFRPGNPLTRGQTSKIVANTFFVECAALVEK